MDKTSLKDFFVPAQNSLEEDQGFEEAVVILNFHYGLKVYATVIALVKEIVDFPVYIPFPHQTKFLGVFNLRGTIVPIFNPHLIDMKSQVGRQRLIVFEVAKGDLVAVPATAIFKKELEKAQLSENQEFVTIEGVPFEYFDIEKKLKECA